MLPFTTLPININTFIILFEGLSFHAIFSHARETVIFLAAE